MVTHVFPREITRGVRPRLITLNPNDDPIMIDFKTDIQVRSTQTRHQLVSNMPHPTNRLFLDRT